MGRRRRKRTMTNTMEEVHLVKQGQVQPIAQINSDHNAFFTMQIVEEGLFNTHITVQSGLDEETKVKAIQEQINNWDVEGELITDL